MLSFAGHRSAQAVIEDSAVDLVATVGNMLGEWGSNNWDGQGLLNGNLVHIESHEANLTRSPMARLHVRGSIDTIFETVIEKLGQRGTHIGGMDLGTGAEPDSSTGASSPLPFEVHELDKCLDASAPIKPQWLMTKLTQLFPPSTRFLADSGNSFAWAIHYLHPYDRRLLERRQCERGDSGRRNATGGLFQAGFEFAPMGWAIGNSVGTALANPGCPVVCITGDGSMLMSGQEITVASQHKLPVIFVILNDSALGMVRHGQQMGGSEAIGFELPEVDFRRFGESMGIRSYQIRTPRDLLGLNITALCQQNAPAILDLHIDPDQAPPIGRRMQVLRNL